jgi:hypothetical protein
MGMLSLIVSLLFNFVIKVATLSFHPTGHIAPNKEMEDFLILCLLTSRSLEQLIELDDPLRYRAKW